MKPSSFLHRHARNVLLLIGLACTVLHAHAAGVVDFASGGVTAVAPDGNSRALSKGAQVNSGDTINTGADGRAQIRFTDGAYLSLQPNTVFKIDSYVFNGRADGSERGIFSLVKGGLRKITGAIGKVNKENYSVNTQPATIGIRGTAYSASLSDAGLTVSVGQGIVALTNEAGSLNIAARQSAFVPNRKTAPKMALEKVLLPRLAIPVYPSLDPRPVDVKKYSEDGVLKSTASIAAALGIPIGPGTPPPGPVLSSGGGFAVIYAAEETAGNPPGAYSPSNLTANVNGAGALISFTDMSQNLNLAGTVEDLGSDQFIGWGRWTGTVTGSTTGTGTYGANEGLHYVAGVLTPLANLNVGSGAQVNYTLIGSTRPTTYSSATTTTTLGTKPVTGSAFVVFTATPTINFNVAIGINNPSNHTYNLGQPGPIAVSGMLTSSIFGGSSTGLNCIGVCTLNFKGFFAGPNGERMGVAYDISEMAGIVTKGSLAFRAP